MSTRKLPETMIEAVRYFADPDVCVEFVAQLRWPDGPVCERCGGMEHSYLSTRRVWKCKACKRQFSVKVGTIFEDSPIGLDKWLPAVWIVANSKNGVSSHELAKSLGITQKSAWFVLHRIRLAMQSGSFDKIDGITEIDETFIGGKARNMHKIARERKGVRQGSIGNKVIVVGMLQRGGNVRATVTPDRTRDTLQGYVRENVAEGATVYTDAHASYVGLDDVYEHATVDHAVAYVDGQVHSNGIENFWSLLKRGLHGTYVSVEPFHLFRYLDERVFTFNTRDLTDLGRFALVLGRISGRRLTYAGLTGAE